MFFVVFFFFLNCCSSPPTSCDVCEVHLAAAGSQLPVWEQGSFIPIAWNLTTWAHKRLLVLPVGPCDCRNRAWLIVFYIWSAFHPPQSIRTFFLHPMKWVLWIRRSCNQFRTSFQSDSDLRGVIVGTFSTKEENTWSNLTWCLQQNVKFDSA